ncbi:MULTISPECIES: shikimate dehydrogenase [Brucella]|uniref:Shikimate 5-dehydrogenase I alpha n=1 Tax=Ochrobactrum soli TaxID=2448455 RepID=A0A2P9HB60_9HYPH|nr:MULTISPECIES: shikimate dehydrogenase [Brucella]MDX4072859.1 shikimate dehydrogenase [Brucella sp. NBRC 113783]SPL61341.1 Shikimate 5-dehydrogenase I alpha [[Ochrobactrum] soli]
MAPELNGALRLHFVIGDPIAQVKSPQGVTEMLQSRGHNAICIPGHVKPEDLASFWQGARALQNLDGIIVTVPHKIAATRMADRLSETAAFLGSVNTLRRTPTGWEGAMFDGMGHVAALRKAGCQLEGKKVLLAGAGGAGGAIAYALVQSGIAELAVHEMDAARRDSLIERLSSLGLAKIGVGTSDPSGFDVIVNATPAGMKEGDALPFDGDKLASDMFVGEVITKPAISPLVARAREIGCGTITGADMFVEVRDLMVDFLCAV